MKSKITISEASKILEISIDTLRRWDKKGLIRSERDIRGNRLFSLEAIERIKNQKNNYSGEFKILNKKISSKKYTAIDLFAGGGGTALGLENSGFEHLAVNDFDKYAAETLRTNRNKWNVLEGDIANFSFKKFRGDVDLVEGGFPCQAFSLAGKKMGLQDARGTLFYEFARVVNEVKPKIAIGENVRGLLIHDKGKTLEGMLSILEQIGYKVSYKLMKAQYHDVPQKRERVIIMAIRKDLDIPFIFPKENDYIITVGEALKNCPSSEGQKYPKKKEEIMKLVPEGGYWRDLPVEVQKSYMGKSFFHGGGKTGIARRLSRDEPSLTLTCAPAQKQTERCHPLETRPLNVREYARIQTFPDEWNFSGSISQQYKQIGNAVPVNLGYHLGVSVIKMLEGKYEKDEIYENNLVDTLHNNLSSHYQSSFI